MQGQYAVGAHRKYGDAKEILHLTGRYELSPDGTASWRLLLNNGVNGPELRDPVSLSKKKCRSLL
jgi:hypothetical protein